MLSRLKKLSGSKPEPKTSTIVRRTFKGPTLEYGNSFCKLHHFSVSDMEAVKDALTFENPELQHDILQTSKLIQYAKRIRNEKMVWVVTQKLEKLRQQLIVCFLKNDAFPTGHLKLVEDVLREREVAFEVADRRELPKVSHLFRWSNKPPPLRPFQEEVVEIAKREGRGVFACSVGCHAPGQQILMFDGTLKNIKDIKIGDSLMGPDSAPRTVLRLFSGEDTMYKVVPKKGAPFVVNQHHVLSLRGTKYRPCRCKNEVFCKHNRIRNLTVEEFLNKSKSFRGNYKLYRAPVNFSGAQNSFLIPPYMLGLWLGDGHASEMSLTTADHVLAKVWSDWGKTISGIFVKVRMQSENRSSVISLCSGHNRSGLPKNTFKNPLNAELHRLKIRKNKHIPLAYKTASWFDRMELLAGLVDSDGYLSPRGSIDLVQKNADLAADILFLARSLGFAAYGKLCQKSCQTGAQGTYTRISISGDLSKIPSRLSGKTAEVRRQKKNVLLVGITSIERLELGPYHGVEVDKDNLNLLDDFTVTHNSGKTRITTELIKEFEVISLLILPSAALVEQTQRVLEEAFGATAVGVLTSDKVKRGARLPPIRLATIQTLASLQKQGLIQEAIGDVGLVYVDEFHHAGSESYTRLLPALDHVYYRFGGTGTFLRNDHRTMELYGFLSNCIYHYPPQRAIEEGYLTPVTYRMYVLDGVQNPDYQREYSANFCGGEPLLTKIHEIVTDVPAEDQILILVDRKEKSGQLIHEFLRERDVESRFISGDDKKAEIIDAIESFNAGKIRVLIGSAVVGEGVDIRATTHLILATGGKSTIKIVQALGRCVRLYPGKDHSYVYDFSFNPSRFMRKHAGMRIGIFREYFAGNVEVFGDDDELVETIEGTDGG